MANRLLVVGLVLVLFFTSWAGAAPSASASAPTPTPQAPGGSTPAAVDPTSVNPLTGLPVEDPSLLALPPALVSISNFPVSARPQTGLSTSPVVFEMYIGEGMTRFLALFYGEYAQGQTTAAEEAANAPVIGPIRSGRLPYEDVRSLYDGFLVMSGAYISVAQQLSSAATVHNKNPNDINGTGISLASLQTLAESYKEARPNAPAVQGMQFEKKPRRPAVKTPSACGCSTTPTTRPIGPTTPPRGATCARRIKPTAAGSSIPPPIS
ncbi:MAG TPA: DUF3048 domain-containing protein [Anaerolineaceae bacterium]|nr:DUF3048 domain-containing protein [Anaerolineaceae bacterium]